MVCFLEIQIRFSFEIRNKKKRGADIHVTSHASSICFLKAHAHYDEHKIYALVIYESMSYFFSV
jgi:hypothetical protein